MFGNTTDEIGAMMTTDEIGATNREKHILFGDTTDARNGFISTTFSDENDVTSTTSSSESVLDD